MMQYMVFQSRLDCGQFHSAYIQGGELFTFGGDGSGQCGHGDVTDQWTPRQVRPLDSLMIAALSLMSRFTLVID